MRVGVRWAELDIEFRGSTDGNSRDGSGSSGSSDTRVYLQEVPLWSEDDPGYENRLELHVILFHGRHAVLDESAAGGDSAKARSAAGQQPGSGEGQAEQQPDTSNADPDATAAPSVEDVPAAVPFIHTSEQTVVRMRKLGNWWAPEEQPPPAGHTQVSQGSLGSHLGAIKRAAGRMLAHDFWVCRVCGCGWWQGTRLLPWVAVVCMYGWLLGRRVVRRQCSAGKQLPVQASEAAAAGAV